MTRFVVVVVRDSGSTEVYGSFAGPQKAYEFSGKLIERDLDAQVRMIEKPTLKNVEGA